MNTKKEYTDKELFKAIWDNNSDFNVTGNSIRWVGLHLETNLGCISGTPIEMYRKAAEDVNSLKKIRFEGAWQFCNRFERLFPTAKDGKCRPVPYGKVSRPEPLQLSEVEYRKILCTGWQKMMDEAHGNDNGVAVDIRDKLIKKYGQKRLIGFLIYTVDNKQKQIVCLSKKDLTDDFIRVY